MKHSIFTLFLVVMAATLLSLQQLAPHAAVQAYANQSCAFNVTVTQRLGDRLADIPIINYLIGLEQINIAYWNYALDSLWPQDKALAEASKKPLYTFDRRNYNFTADDYDQLKLIRRQEQTWLARWIGVVQAWNATLPQNCSYTFKVNAVTGMTWDQFLSASMSMENLLLGGYLGQLSNFSSTEYRDLAASIATVRARHVAYIQKLNGVTSFPGYYDFAMSLEYVMRRLVENKYLGSCPAENSMCFGKQKGDSTVCGGNGRCLSPDWCYCNPGYTGDQCQTQCDARVTGGCGVCNGTLGTQCCEDTRYGPMCYSPARQNCIIPISRRGPTLLCGKNEQACGMVCYDANVYRCDNDQQLVFAPQGNLMGSQDAISTQQQQQDRGMISTVVSVFGNMFGL